MIEAKVIQHSINDFGDELITIQTKAPKYLDAEIEKHRMISSNSSSDRAIPFNKMLSRDIFIPTDVRLNQRGMQGYESVNEESLLDFQRSMRSMYEHITKTLSNFQHIHKQHLNRYLIGFTLQDKVMTANRDQWDYFLGLRLGKDAAPAIQQLSICIDDAIKNSIGQNLSTKTIPYHLPYITAFEYTEFFDAKISLDDLIKISCARCARVSYLTHDQKRTNLQDDIDLYDMLVSSVHLTPLEHVARAISNNDRSARQEAYELLVKRGLDEQLASYTLYTANFKGFISHRVDHTCK